MATPTITDPVPLPGDFAGDREADRRAVVSFRHNRINASSLPVVWARVASQIFMVYDGVDFVPLFAGLSVVAEDGDEFSFDVQPAGGWWGEAELFSADGYRSVPA